MPLAHHIDGRKTGNLQTEVHHGLVNRERQGSDPVSALGRSTRRGQDPSNPRLRLNGSLSAPLSRERPRPSRIKKAPTEITYLLI
ncbi:hypothetical protein PGA2_c31310 [Phaeobacter inhibens 2.10]|nr:hypothetical protein PGA2_c31310 [Phaeobacter inhibens 2.10]